MAKAQSLPTTQRAYTLRLRGTTPGDHAWRDALWATHESVNKGAKAFGDWLLTLRGGLDHALERLPDITDSEIDKAFEKAKQDAIKKNKNPPERDDIALKLRQLRDQENQPDAIRDRRILLVLSWLSVEDEYGAPQDESLIVAKGTDSADCRARKLCDALAAILRSRGVGDDDLGDSQRQPEEQLGTWLGDCMPSLSAAIRDKAVWVNRSAVFDGVCDGHDLAEARDDARMVLWFLLTNDYLVIPNVIAKKSEEQKDAEEQDEESVNTRAAAEAAIKSGQGAGRRTRQAFTNLFGVSEREPVFRCKDHWRDHLATKLKKVIPFRKLPIPRKGFPETELQREMFSKAASRLAQIWTKQKQQEVERQLRKAADGQLKELESDQAWSKALVLLDEYCREFGLATGVLDEYRLNPRAVVGWDRIVAAWERIDESDPIKAIEKRKDEVTRLQGEDDEKKPGDANLFRSLAESEYELVWRHPGTGEADASVLTTYVKGWKARTDAARLKVAAFRHPDPYLHPVFCQFGVSRPAIKHNRLEPTPNSDPRIVRMRLWTGCKAADISLLASSKRFDREIGLATDVSNEATSVSRRSRLGVAAVGSRHAVGPFRVARVFDRQEKRTRQRTEEDEAGGDAEDEAQSQTKKPTWNGTLQANRFELQTIARLELSDPGKARSARQRIRWSLIVSLDLQPQGPWLDYVAVGLPEGIEFKKGRSGYYLNYTANQGRKSRARLQLARLPGLRVLSLDLGHRYAAACAVWETITGEEMLRACEELGHPRPTNDALYLHLRRCTNTIQKRGRNKGKPVEATTVYRRIGPDVLPDGSVHPAPWARLERQFLIKLQGEDRDARPARRGEIDAVNAIRDFLGVPRLAETPRIDDLQRDSVRLARLGLRRLGDMARIAFTMTATKKPISGGRDVELSREQRIDYLQGSLLLWRELAGSSQYTDAWASQAWHDWVVEKFRGPPTVKTAEDARDWSRMKKNDATREILKPVAERLADPCSEDAVELQKLWAGEYVACEQQWRKHLRSLRRIILPRKKNCPRGFKDVRRVGGLSVKRLKTIRDLYQVLKAFHMRPEPDNLRKNIPSLGDESLANFGRRILNQLERLREQRIKQLASRVVEAALGAGRMKKPPGRDRKRPRQCIDRPCHAVVVENLEYYRPEDSRLRRENRQLMDWAARNVRKYIIEGCELHGLHFVEVAPAYTSRQDSRTGAPGIRCEEVSREVFVEAARRVQNTDPIEASTGTSSSEMRFEREVRRCARELKRAKDQNGDPSARDLVLITLADAVADVPASRSTICLPRRGGELFVSLTTGTKSIGALQADLNAAANIGLKALSDPDWMGAWWFVLVNLATGQPNKDKVQGCPLWDNRFIWEMPDATDGKPSSKRGAKRPKTDVYAWNPMFATISPSNTWLATKRYWNEVERQIADRLRLKQLEVENPF